MTDTEREYRAALREISVNLPNGPEMVLAIEAFVFEEIMVGRVAIGKAKVLQVLAESIASGEPASSGYLAKKCGLSVEEWHGSGELVAALLFFGQEKGFLKWHAKSMV